MSAPHRTWLTLWCAAMAGFGLLLAGAGFPATDAPARLLLGLMNASFAASLDAQARFAVGLMGCVTIGWALTVWTLVAAADTLPPAAWRRLTAALLLWYALDNAISLANGYWVNVVANTLLLAAFLLPVHRAGLLRSRPAPTQGSPP